MPHISFSEIKNWAECPWRHKLLYVDKLDVRSGNEYSAFGTAVHDTVEKMLQGTDQDPYEYFHLKFNEQLAKSATDTGSKLAEDMRVQINGVRVYNSCFRQVFSREGWVDLGRYRI